MRHVRTSRMFVVIFALRPSAAGLLADDNKEEDQYEDTRHKDNNAYHLLQTDVPGVGDQIIAVNVLEFTHCSTETLRAVALIGAVRILALSSVGTRVLDALINITQAPGQHV